MSDTGPLRQTSLHAVHRELGARMVPFGGWDMPVQYSGIKAEHRAVRDAAGLFDVSHMGELRVRGAGALDLVQKLTPNDAAKLSSGRVQYSALTTERGTFVDDILVYRMADDDFLLVVNAANSDKDFAWCRDHNGVAGVDVVDQSGEFALLAVQGPRAAGIVQRLVKDVDLDEVGYYRFVTAAVAGHPDCIVSRTGYTGEDGFEIYLEAGRAPELWRRLLSEGAGDGLKPCGLGARDTLRLEAKLPLYGNDIDEDTTVVEADLGWIVKPAKGAFLGSDVLVEQKKNGVARKLIGFEMTGRGVPRHGFPVRLDGEPTGEAVRSGGFAPHLGKSIGLVYLPSERSEPGTEFEVEIRGRWVVARVVPTPFVPHNTRLKKKKAPPA